MLDLGRREQRRLRGAQPLDGRGRVFGVDFTGNDHRKAKNAMKLGYANVEFIKLTSRTYAFWATRVDVVVSNCVLNLVPDKRKAFGNAPRVAPSTGTSVFRTSC
ncbi:MAG: methyltransferase domain-containing protein [Flavobacteriales bacterium]|nr:methyltransferase domain-containing protein [Flavobacteriales bacterium]